MVVTWIPSSPLSSLATSLSVTLLSAKHDFPFFATWPSCQFSKLFCSVSLFIVHSSLLSSLFLLSSYHMQLTIAIHFLLFLANIQQLFLWIIERWGKEGQSLFSYVGVLGVARSWQARNRLPEQKFLARYNRYTSRLSIVIHNISLASSVFLLPSWCSQNCSVHRFPSHHVYDPGFVLTVA